MKRACDVGDRLGDRCVRCRVAVLRQCVEELCEHGLDVADARELDVVAGPEVARVVGDLAERRLCRHGRDVQRAREARADPEDQVGALEVLVDRRRARARGRSERERVILGEGALPVQRRRHRRRGALGEPDELVGGVRVEHPLTGHDHGVRGRSQHARGLCHIVRGGLAQVPAQRRQVPVRRAGVAVQHVVRDGDEHRAVADAVEGVECLAEEAGPVSRVAQRRREARDRAVGLLAADAHGRVEHARRVLARQQQDRAPVAVRLRDRAVGGLRPGAVLGHARQEALAVAGAGEPVRDVDGHALGARDDGPHPAQRGRVEQPVLREAHDELGTLRWSSSAIRSATIGIGIP